MPRPAWTPEQKLAAKERIAAKKAAAAGAGGGGITQPAAPSKPNICIACGCEITEPDWIPGPEGSSHINCPPTKSLQAPTPPPTIASFNRIVRNGQEIARVAIKPLTESLTSLDVPEPVHERLSGLVHVNTAIPKLRDANRVKDIAWTRYQIACQVKALEKLDKELEEEGRELLITYDCGAEPLRFDFLRIKLGRGGGGERIDRKKLEAAGVALDVISQCSNSVKTWERMQVSDGTEKEYSRE